MGPDRSGVRHADVDGNEVDLVPGDKFGDLDTTEDWHEVFAAMACYRTASSTQRHELAVAVATLADDAGFPLLIDLRPNLMIIDSGKDRWHADAHGLDLDFAELAGNVQTVARRLGAVPDPSSARFVQLFFDAADVGAVRSFWATALGYRRDRRDGVTDIHDPRYLSPVVVFQELDASATERRRQRNRMHVELAVPSDQAMGRVQTAIDAGGRLLTEASERWRIADPEGNELEIAAVM